MMKGLELARKFYEDCRQELYSLLPDVMPCACAGLSGEGSECFGCDDKTSRDHDFGAAFCLWLPDEILKRHRRKIEEAFRLLPNNFAGVTADFAHSHGRRGPRGIRDYYAFFTALDHVPHDWREWLAIPEFQLAAATNGQVFEDNANIFSDWRAKLLAFYPEDVRLKKLAARCMHMAQSGQYNLPRCLARGEYAAAMLALARFAENAISFVFLANKHYMPFYKWAPRLVRMLPILGAELGALLDNLVVQPAKSEESYTLVESVENLCAACAAWLRENGMSDEKDSWLWGHGPELIARVKQPELRAMDLLLDKL